jgi:hypothetical protein
VADPGVVLVGIQIYSNPLSSDDSGGGDRVTPSLNTVHQLLFMYYRKLLFIMYGIYYLVSYCSSQSESSILYQTVER